MPEEIAVLATASVILRVSYGSNMRREMAKIVWGVINLVHWMDNWLYLRNIIVFDTGIFSIVIME